MKRALALFALVALVPATLAAPAHGQPRHSADLVVRSDAARARFRLFGSAAVISGGGPLAVLGPLRPGNYTILFEPLPPRRARPAPLALLLPAAARAHVGARWRDKRDPRPEPPLLNEGFSPGVLVLEPGRRLLRGGTGWDDYWLGVSVRVARPRGVVGVEFRRRGPKETYRLEWRLAEGVCRLVRLAGDGQVELGRLRVRPRPGGWHRIECEAVGFGLRARVDGAEVARLLDGGQAAGGIALFAEGDPAEFDDLLVLRPLREHGVLAAVETPGNLVLRLALPRRPGGLALLELRAPLPGPGRQAPAIRWRPRRLDVRGRAAAEVRVPASRSLLGCRLRARAVPVAETGRPDAGRLGPIDLVLR